METRLATIPVLSTQHSITLEKSIRLFHKVRVLVFFFSVMLVLDRCFAHGLFAHNLFAHTSFVHNFLFFFSPPSYPRSLLPVFTFLALSRFLEKVYRGLRSIRVCFCAPAFFRYF